MIGIVDEKQFLKGTTTVGVTFEGGLVLAADKRATMGTFIAAKNVVKVHEIGEKMAMSIAGGVGDAQTLVRLMKAELELYKYSKGRELTVKGASTLLSNVLQNNKYFPYMVQLIVGGFDSQPRLFDLDVFGGLIEEEYVSTGSGSVVAYGILDQGYKKGMPEADGVKLAVNAVAAAMKRDNATGEGVDAVIITKDGSRRLSKEDTIKLISN